MRKKNQKRNDLKNPDLIRTGSRQQYDQERRIESRRKLENK